MNSHDHRRWMNRIEKELKETKKTFDVIMGTLEEIKGIKTQLSELKAPPHKRFDTFAWGALCALLVIFAFAIIYSK